MPMMQQSSMTPNNIFNGMTMPQGFGMMNGIAPQLMNNNVLPMF
jgi:hypothetical protein